MDTRKFILSIFLIVVVLILFVAAKALIQYYIFPEKPVRPLPRFSANEKYGHFVGIIKTKWSQQNDFMILLEPVSYTDGNGKKWIVPKGAVVNGSSIPVDLWSVLGYAPYNGPHRIASVFHDYYTEKQTSTWQTTHQMYYDACLCSGVPIIKAKLMFAALWHFGPKWGFSAKTFRGPLSTNQKKEKLQQYLRNTYDPSF